MFRDCSRLKATNYKAQIYFWVLDLFLNSTKDIIVTTGESGLVLDSSHLSHVRMEKLCLPSLGKEVLNKLLFVDASQNSGCKMSCYSES